MATKTITRLASFKIGNIIKESDDFKIGDYVSFIIDEGVGIIIGISENIIEVIVLYSNSKRLTNGRYLKGHIKWFHHVEEVLLRTEKVKTNGN